jgi:hypothetical protein
MLQQSNNTAEIDKTGYTLASAVKALNSIEDLPDLREVNTTGVNLSLCLALQSNLQIALCVVAVNHILKTIGWLNLLPYLQGFVSLRVELQNPF